MKGNFANRCFAVTKNVVELGKTDHPAQAAANHAPSTLNLAHTAAG
jgi:hypothetical protein